MHIPIFRLQWWFILMIKLSALSLSFLTHWESHICGYTQHPACTRLDYVYLSLHSLLLGRRGMESAASPRLRLGAGISPREDLGLEKLCIWPGVTPGSLAQSRCSVDTGWLRGYILLLLTWAVGHTNNKMVLSPGWHQRAWLQVLSLLLTHCFSPAQALNLSVSSLISIMEVIMHALLV